MLFVFDAVFPLVQRVVRNDSCLCCLVTALFFVPAETDILLRLCRFAPLFVYGHLTRKYALLELMPPRLGAAISLGVFCAACIAPPLDFLSGPPLVSLTAAISGTAMWVYVALWLDQSEESRLSAWLARAGEMSATIYLFHQPLVWLVPVVMYRFLGISGNLLLLGVPMALFLGLVTPVTIQRHVLDRSRLLKTLFLGEKPPTVETPVALRRRAA